MTTKEFRDLYDSLFYGHEAELKYDGRCFYLEQNGMSTTLYELDGDITQPLKKIIAATRQELTQIIFNEKVINGKSLNDLRENIEVTAID
ncbi:hypothetical protein [Faecalibacterium prausnitzii]|uniref:hypothetical protein n=1 Tax=Faecalibacterium prausnitzii TaxID=853 RepID=UPI0012DEF5F4|nr:hypothetical protein [Faecalibacterium prausnitzii]